MNKKLLSAAIGATLFAAGSLASHAATTLYGHMHLSWDRLDDGGSVERSFISSNSTRVGLKGDEDFGGGLKGIWQIESGALGIDDATNGFGGDLRNSFVGFSNKSWGTVKIGRHDTPFKDLGRRLDNFNEQVGDSRNLFGNPGAPLEGETGFDLRPKNMVRYESPSFGGLNFSALQSTNNATNEAAATSQSVTSLGANWTAGPLFIGAAYETHSTGLGATAGTEDKEKGIRLAASYALGGLTLGAMYEMLDDVFGESDLGVDTYGLFASFKAGNNKFKAQYLMANDFDCPTGVDCNNTGANMIAIGMDHSLSKTTTLYVNYAKTDNDQDAAIATVGTNDVGYQVVSANGGHGELANATCPATGSCRDPSAFSVGVIMKF